MPSPLDSATLFACSAEPSDTLKVYSRVCSPDVWLSVTETFGGKSVGAAVALSPDAIRELCATLVRLSPTAAPPAPPPTIPADLVQALRHFAEARPHTLAEVRGGSTQASPTMRLLAAVDRHGLLAPPKSDVSGFMSPCPPGFGTVLGHLVQQGIFPEDMGLAEGRRLAVLAKSSDVPRIWVDVSPALEEVCDRVRAYPADFLTTHLGEIA